MKCIKALRASKEYEVGEIKRVDDKTANNMVGLSWEYVSKTEWKKWRGVKTKSDDETAPPKKKSNPKQMDGVPSDEPFVKTRKKSK
jgi:hypothetical protein